MSHSEQLIRRQHGARSSAAPISVLVIGDLRRNEFREILGTFDSSLTLTTASDPHDAMEYLERTPRAPTLIVVAQSWPGEFSGADIETLRRAAPLARVWTVSGSWCEGEVRTGRPCAGALRSYWHQWPARWRHEMTRVRLGRAPVWSLPVTTSLEERLLQADDDLPRRRSGLVAIDARSRSTTSMLVDACRFRGYATVSTSYDQPIQLEGAIAALWDTTAEAVCDAERVQAVKRRLGQAPLVALLNFPRREVVDRAQAAGVAGVVSKPMLLEDLYWQLDRVTQL